MTKRILSIVLCLAMIVGIIPMSVFAADTETVLDAAIFCSDVHGNPSTVTSIFNGIKSADSTLSPTTAAFVGDTQCASSSVTSAAQGVFNGMQCIYAYGNHDGEGNYGISDFTGLSYGDSTTNYYIYTISESSMGSSNPDTSGFTNTVASLDKSKPLFIISHLPLHDRRGDSKGAATWYTAISAAAEKMDIFFFWAHNHTGDNEVDQAAYYVAKDGSESITLENTSTTVIPNFTYANAGYIDPPNTPARNNVATVVRIYEDSVNLTVYNANGELSGSYAVNETVTREFADTAEAVSIDVTGTTRYTVGGNSLALKVTATYNDGTTAVVTDDCTFTGVDLTKSGKYTLTATYGELTDTLDVVVAAYGEDAIISVEVVSTGVTAVELTNVYGEPDLSDSFEDYVAYNVALENYTTGNEIEYTMSIPEDMDTTNLGLYHVATVDGETVLTPVDFTVVNDCIVFTSALTGTFAYGAITVPDGYTLYSIEASNYTKDWFVGDSLDITSPFMVTATYKKVDSDDFIRVISVYEENNNPDGYIVDMDSFDMTTAGTYNVKLSYTYEGVTCETTFPITVWGKTFTGSDVTVTVGSHGVASVTMTDVSAASNVTAAVGALLNSYNAYDIVPELAENYELTGTATVKMPAPTNADVVYYFNDTTGALTKMEDATFADGYVTFTTDHFSIYVVGETSEADEETLTLGGTTTTTKTVYVLTSSISSGNEYLIVNGNSAGSYYALANNSGSVSATGVTIKTDSTIGTYIELDDATDELWTVGTTTQYQQTYYTFKNNSHYLSYTTSGDRWDITYELSLSESSTAWSYATNQIYTGWQSRYYVTGGSSWSISSNSSNVYFYVPTEVEVEVDTSTKYEVSAEDIEFIYPTSTSTDSEGNATTTLVTTTGAALTYELLANGSAVSFDGEVWTVAVVSDANGIIDTNKSDNSTLYFTGNVGEAKVRVYYQLDANGDGDVTDDDDYKVWTTITVKATAPYYSIQLHKAELTKVDITAFADGVTYYTYNSTTNTYQVAESYVEGTTYYTTPVVKGDEITNPIALKGIEAGDTYSVWAVVKEYTNANPDGGDMGSLGNALTWKVSDESIATIDTTTGVITFTGNNYGTFTVTVSYKGADGKVITDTITISVTDSLYTVPGDGTNDFPEYPNEGAVRFDKTATAVGNFSETGITKVELSMTGVPYSTGSEIDVVLMLDMTGSMSDTAMIAAEEAAVAFVAQIVKNEDGTYNKNRIAVYAFNSGSSSPYELVALGTIDSDTELEAANTAIRTASDKQASGGTPYDEALEKCQSVLAEAKTTNLPEGVESAEDYARQQFCVFMSDGGPTSYQYITNYDAVKAGTATEYTTSSASATGGSNQSDSNFATIATYTHEYYSTLMKDDGVTMFSVLTGLSKASYPNCATILENIASSSNNAYVVESGNDTSAVTNALSSIAQKIVEAAKDVVVEDKIGNNFSVNFSLPGYGTDYALGADALDGLSEFYIQVVEYQLDANKERTGTPTVLENFTFNQDGTLKSHTVDGVACSSCAHVTITDGVITKIDGTYFDYERKTEIENGKTIDAEYLTWNADKLTTTELALQYFAWLDNSSGVPENQQVPADTYYTNEYATLTYTNFQGKRVQQEMPVPQMTWNGAQVSYVFYLVNDQGQPVNRAGKVVPFAEAVYVTDVFTKEVIWNDLEQLASLDAEFLAGELVPGVYELYDDDATYFIHVYEKENEVNLNNHFVIGGDVTDSTNRTNANTTIVFNTKSGTRYYTVGTYVADDGDNSSGESNLSYLCKGDGTISGITFTVDPNASIDSFATNVYYTLENGIYKRALHYSEGNTYYKLTAATYTAITGETQVPDSEMDSTSGGTVINGYVYYVDENGAVYTIVRKSNGIEVEAGYDFSNTTVAFAVVWKPELVEDTIVVDFGLDVVIDVTTNDAMAAGVVGVRGDAPSNVTINSGTYGASKVTSVDLYIDELKIGTATVENLTSVRFSLDKTNGMQFTDPVVFYYEADVNFYDNTGALQTTSMYSSVTIIPATTVYYEDSFVTFETDNWSVDGTAANKTQDQDRPGESKISADLDADNNYGYDSAYTQMSKYSLGSAHKATVSTGSYAVAVFTFYGTGFDVISLTSNTTGTIFVDVYEGAYAKQSEIPEEKLNSPAKSFIVDTYYGYAYQSKDMNGDGVVSEGEGEWAITPNTPNSLYQVPVIKVSGLDYKQYTVVICAAYDTFFDHNGTGSYDFYLDAIRIYDPTGNQNEDANNAYVEDGEGWPTYFEVRNKILDANSFNNLNDGTSVSGVVFIDGASTDPDGNVSIGDYKSYGPNNELYLANSQAIAFDLNATATAGAVAKVQLAIKTVGGTGKVEVYGVNADGSRIDCLATAVATATDMYYDITALNGKTVVIKNAGTESDAIVSVTNVKVTYTEAQPETTEEPAVLMFSIRRSTANAALATMNVEEDSETEPTVPEETVPEETIPEETIPEETVPEETVPEETVPEETVPEETVPEETIPEENEPETFEPEKLEIDLNKNKVKEGDKVKVTIKTSGDVAYIIVNGEIVTDYRSNRRTSEKTWTITLKAEEPGELEIEVVAYDDDGVASDAVTETVTVEAKKNPAEIVKDILKGVLGWLFG